MKPFIFCVLLFLCASPSQAQDLPFSPVTVNELLQNRYEKDSSASAVVLKEFGEAHINNGEGYHLIFTYRARIKILNKNGLNQANIEIPLRKQGNNLLEKIVSLKAFSFNIEDNQIRQVALQEKDVFTENRNKSFSIKKFAIPNVREGSIIEISYTLDSPFIYNFRTWEFQSDIPKMESEYWASIPGVYLYNIALRGFQNLSKNETKMVSKCLGGGDDGRGNGYSADCALRKFGMKHVPAFAEEDYMTSKYNFISSVQFELSEIRRFDGTVDKITKEWRDAEAEMKQDQKFGIQLKRGKDIGEQVKKLIENENDELTKAKKIYDFIKGWYHWNNTFGMFSELGIKKAFDEKTGNVGDINLSLVAALRFAGLDVEPVILSTRANGQVTELYPVLSEFNYVIAKVNIGDQIYLADATEKNYPFNMLPERCLNGKGRVLGERSSYWVDLKPSVNRKIVTLLTLKLENDGVMRGSLNTSYLGYDAVTKRTEILSHQSQEDYIRELKNTLSEISITGYEIKNLDDTDKPLSRNLNIEIAAFDNPQTANFLFNPFLMDKWAENPFKSKERLYPVDFGVPLIRVTILNLEYPDAFQIVNVPQKVGVSLPNSGGRFILEATNQQNTLTLNNSLTINKSVFSAAEYHYLKELFSRILQVQNGELIFRKKT